MSGRLSKIRSPHTYGVKSIHVFARQQELTLLQMLIVFFMQKESIFMRETAVKRIKLILSVHERHSDTR